MFFKYRIHKGGVEDIATNSDAVGFEVTNGSSAKGSISWLTRYTDTKAKAYSLPDTWHYSISPLLMHSDTKSDTPDEVYGWLACVRNGSTPVQRGCSVTDLGPKINLIRASGQGRRDMQDYLVKHTGLPRTTFDKAPLFYPVESVSEALFDFRLMMGVFMLVPMLFYGGILWFASRSE